MKGLTLTTTEQTRLQVLNAVAAKLCAPPEAAEVLGISERHVWRLLAAYRKEGAAALAHGNRGRAPLNTIPPGVRDKVVALARGRYNGVNHTHLSELLAEREAVLLSRSTVRRVLLGAGLPSRRQRRPRHRMRRQRMPQAGMLVQMDGSQHAWLEERGPKLTLHLAIDDATGVVPYSVFQEGETTHGYLLLLQGMVRNWGIPLAIYTDRHATFRATRPRTHEGVPGLPQGRTQLARALRELGVTQIFALSPEGKGRVERANGTFQDRLCAELRLAEARTLADANRVLLEFLPRFNARFGVPAAEPGSAYRQPAPGFDLDGVLCLKELRQVARDNTVQYRGRVLQLFPDAERPSYAGSRVELQERLDGRILVSYRGKLLTPQDAPPLAATLREKARTVAAHPPRWEDLYPAPPPRPMRPKAPRPPGPLAGDAIWYEDPLRKDKHRELVRAGMERARQAGTHLGRPRVLDRDGFLGRFVTVMERVSEGTLSRRQAAAELEVGYASLKRLIDAGLAAADKQTSLTLAATPEVDRFPRSSKEAALLT